MLKVMDKFHEIKRIGNIYGDNKGTGFAGNVWDKSRLSPTITTMQGGGREPMIVVEVKNEAEDSKCVMVCEYE